MHEHGCCKEERRASAGAPIAAVLSIGKARVTRHGRPRQEGHGRNSKNMIAQEQRTSLATLYLPAFNADSCRRTRRQSSRSFQMMFHNLKGAHLHGDCEGSAVA